MFKKYMIMYQNMIMYQQFLYQKSKRTPIVVQEELRTMTRLVPIISVMFLFLNSEYHQEKRTQNVYQASPG